MNFSIHRIVQPSPQSTLELSLQKHLYLLSVILTFPHPSALGNH